MSLLRESELGNDEQAFMAFPLWVDEPTDRELDAIAEQDYRDDYEDIPEQEYGEDYRREQEFVFGSEQDISEQEYATDNG